MRLSHHPLCSGGGCYIRPLIQQEVVAAQCRELATRRPTCRSCAAVCQVKDYRPRQIATLFGQVTVRLPRFRCAGCGTMEAAVEWPARCRSTPELDQLQAHLSALMPYRAAAGVLAHFLPVDAGISHESLRGRTLKLGAELRDAAADKPATAVAAITLTLDSTFIRSCEEGQRHLEVRLGNVEASSGSRQVFAAVAKTDTTIAALVQRSLAEVGQAQETGITAFTDGCSGLRSILIDAGITAPPYLDWFHIAMRLQHAEQVAGSLPIDMPEREHARAVIVTEIDRLHWRIWNGKAKDARITLERIRDVLPAFQGEDGGKESGVAPAVEGVARDRPLPVQPKRLAHRLRRAPSRRSASGHRADRSNGQLPGQPPHEQSAADAMVPPRRRSPTPGPLCRSQRQTRFWFRSDFQS